MTIVICERDIYSVSFGMIRIIKKRNEYHVLAPGSLLDFGKNKDHEKDTGALRFFGLLN
jgi:hypothetical protein